MEIRFPWRKTTFYYLNFYYFPKRKGLNLRNYSHIYIYIYTKSNKYLKLSLNHCKQTQIIIVIVHYLSKHLPRFFLSGIQTLRVFLGRCWFMCVILYLLFVDWFVVNFGRLFSFFLIVLHFIASYTLYVVFFLLINK